MFKLKSPTRKRYYNNDGKGDKLGVRNEDWRMKGEW